MTQIALVDDGELEDVRAALDELGVEYLRWRKGDAPPPPKVTQLLVTTPGHAVQFRYQRAVARRPDPSRARWIVVTDNESQSIRKKVMAAGFDTFVCRPVHPAALLALLHDAIFAGDDRRIRRRVIVGATVTLRSGRRSVESILIDAGPHGCRLLTEEPLPSGAKVSVQFPKSIAGRSFWHDGQVVRSNSLKSQKIRGVDLGVRFDPFSQRDKELMLCVLNGHKEGPCKLLEKVRASLLGPEREPTKGGLARHSKRARRGVYESEVGIDGLSHFALSARDLSVKGLRVAPHEALTLGARLRIELKTAGDQSVLIDAEVTRLDGERGTVLMFDWVDVGARARISSFVDGLQPVWSGSPSQLDDEDPDTAPTLAHTVGRLMDRVLTRNRGR